MDFHQFLEAKYNSNYDDIVVKQSGDQYNIADAKTGGDAFLTIKKTYIPELNKNVFDDTTECISIIRWNAAPLSAIMDRGLQAQDDYRGGGFARNAMKKIVEIAKAKNIKVLTIFGPSPDSQKVLNHYSQTGLLTAIPSSKAALGDFYTQFFINY